VALSEYLTPILATGRPAALLFIALRFGPDAFLRLLVGTVAVLTKDDKRGERCLKVLRTLRKMDDPPEIPPSKASP
jgi:hypothetical protein